MNLKIEQSARALQMPLNALSRVFLLVAGALVLASYVVPLWNVSISGPNGKSSRVAVYSYTLGIPSYGEQSGPRTAASSAVWAGVEPSGWIAIGLAGMVLLLLRAVLLGTTRSLIDAFVLYVFFCVASLWTFSLQLFRFAHHLSPDAAGGPSMSGILFGRSKIGNIELVASPAAGAWTLAAVGLVLGAALVIAWKNARREFSADRLVAG